MKSYSVTILMKPAEQYLPVVLLTRQVLTFDFVEEIIKRGHSNLMKPSVTMQSFSMTTFLSLIQKMTALIFPFWCSKKHKR